jgi:hypothetical protein
MSFEGVKKLKESLGKGECAANRQFIAHWFVNVSAVSNSTLPQILQPRKKLKRIIALDILPILLAETTIRIYSLQCGGRF